MTLLERLSTLVGLLLGVYGVLALGFQLALWSIRTGRVDVRKIIKELGK